MANPCFSQGPTVLKRLPASQDPSQLAEGPPPVIDADDVM